MSALSCVDVCVCVHTYVGVHTDAHVSVKMHAL